MAAELEDLVYRKAFLHKAINTEKFEEGVAQACSMPANKLAQALMGAIKSGKLAVALAISEAVLRKPILRYELALELVKSGDNETPTLLGVSRAFLHMPGRDLRNINEDIIGSVEECAKYSLPSQSIDVRRCREKHVSSLLDFRDEVTKFLSSSLPLAFVPNQLVINKEGSKMGVEKYVASWPYIVRFSGKPYKISWYLGEDEESRYSVKIEGSVEDLEGTAIIGGRALFILRTSTAGEYAIFTSVRRRPKLVRGLKVCYDGLGQVYVLGRKDGRNSITVYDQEGVEIYEKSLDVSFKDSSSLTCTSFPGVGVIFNIVKPNKSVLIYSSVRGVNKFIAENPIKSIIALPLNLAVGVMDNGFVYFMISNKGGEPRIVRDRVKFSTKYMGKVLSLSGLGIAYVANNGLNLINAVGMARNSLELWSKMPESIGSADLGTFSLLWTRDRDGFVNKMFIMNGKTDLKPLKISSLSPYGVRDISYTSNLVCLLSGEGYLRCFSPLYLRAIASQNDLYLPNIRSAKDLLHYYSKSDTAPELLKVVYTGCEKLSTWRHDSSLYRLSTITKYARNKLKNFMAEDLEKIVLKSLKYNISLSVLGMVLNEYLSKLSNYKGIASGVELAAEKLRLMDKRVRPNVDALLTTDIAYRVLSDVVKLRSLDNKQLLSYLEKFIDGIKSLGVGDVDPGTLQRVLPDECIRHIIHNLIDYALCHAESPYFGIILKYLKFFGIKLESIIQVLNEARKLSSEFGIKDYGEVVIGRVKRMIMDGRVPELNTRMNDILNVFNEARRLLEKYNPLFSHSVASEIDDALQIIGVDEGESIRRLKSIKACYEELLSINTEIQKLIQADDWLSGIDTSTNYVNVLNGAVRCSEKLAYANQFRNRLQTLRSVLTRFKQRLNDLSKFPVRPEATVEIERDMRECISTVNMTCASRRLDELDKYYSITEAFNEAISKLNRLTRIQLFEFVKPLINELIDEFRRLNLSKLDSHYLRKLEIIKAAKELNTVEAIKYINDIMNNVGALFINPELVEGIAKKFAHEVFEDNAYLALQHLKLIDEALKQFSIVLRKYSLSINNAVSAFKKLDVKESVLARFIQVGKSSINDMISSLSPKNLVAEVGRVQGILIVRERMVENLRHKIELLVNALSKLEPEIRAHYQKMLTSLMEERITNTEEKNLLNDLLAQINKIEVEVRQLRDIDKYLKRLKHEKESLMSVTAKRILDTLIDGTTERIKEGRLAEAMKEITFGNHVLVNIKNEALDDLLSVLNKNGLEILQLRGIRKDRYVEDISQLIRDVKRLSEINAFLRACPDCVSRLIKVAGGATREIISAFKLALIITLANSKYLHIQELEGGIEKVCEVFRSTGFSTFEDTVITVLASLGERLSDRKAHDEKDLLALAYLVLIKYFSDLATKPIACGEVLQETGFLRELYEEACVRRNIKKALVSTAMVCAKRKTNPQDCRIAVELFGGIYVAKLVKLVRELELALGTEIDEASANRLVIDVIAKPIAEEGLRSLNSVVRSLKRWEELHSELTKHKELVDALRNAGVGREASQILQASKTYLNFYENKSIPDPLEAKVYGEIEDGRESKLILEVCNKTPAPLLLHEAVVNFIDLNYRIPQNLRELHIEPLNCKNTDFAIPRIAFSYSKLELGKEVVTNIELHYSLPGLRLRATYGTPAYIPVKYFGMHGELIETIEDVSKYLMDKKIAIDINRIHDAIIGVGGNNIVVYGKKGYKEVVIKIPVFYKDVENLTLSQRIIEGCRKVAERCISATKECSEYSIASVLEINLMPPYAVEEYIRGNSLRRLIIDEGRLSTDKVLPVILKVANGIQCLHSHGIYHNDLRPENVIVKLERDRISNIYIIDSCIDHVWNMYRTSLGVRDLRTSRIGENIDERYLHPDLEDMLKKASPELRAKVHKMIDVFQLGLLIYEMMLGYNPISLLRKSDKQTYIARTRTALQKIYPERLRALIGRILFPGNNEFVTLNEFIDEIRKIMKEVGIHT